MEAVLFPTHLAVGAIIALESRLSVWWLLLGATLPDLVDKPLAMIGLVDLFHTVGHSALLGVILLPAAYVNRSALALTVGWLSHLALDAFHVVVNGRPTDALFLGWPVVVPPDPFALAPVPFLLQYLWSPSFWIELGIWATLAAILRYRSRRPARRFGPLSRTESD